MRKFLIIAIGTVMLSGSLMAQGEIPQGNNERKERPQGHRPPRGQRPPGRPGGMGMLGGPGSRSKDIKYAGATELTAQTNEVGKTYKSSKTDESALMISTKEAVTITQPNVSKTGNSDGGDRSTFGRSQSASPMLLATPYLLRQEL